jgi:hypothetical protein
MNSYQVLKTIHKVGHPISARVLGYKHPSNNDTFPYTGRVLLEANSEYNVELPYLFTVDDLEDFDESFLPKIGSKIKAVIKTHVDNTLFVSTKPSDVNENEIKLYKEFYEFVGKNEEGTHIKGIVKKVEPFGLFVDIGVPFIGLIDIGHTSFNQGKRLPYDQMDWPKEGETIACVIAYYRFDGLQIGLGWIPE